MGMEREHPDFSKNFADWQSASAFNTYWQYSYVNRSAFYANIRGEYREYMVRWVENYLWWYDGWVPYFHNNAQGIFSTRIGAAFVNGAAKKVVGGRIFFKNKNEEAIKKKDADGKYIINHALAFISSDWADSVGFGREVKKAITFAAAAGTSLLKLDRQGGKLVPKALRFDSFYPTVGFNGQIIELYCFIKDFTKLADVGKETRFTNFYVVEHRYFGPYQKADGTVLPRAPLCKYEIRRSTGTITSGQSYDATGENVRLQDLPSAVRNNVCKAFDGIEFEKPILLPFKDHLGAELVNWTDCVSAIPELPFGESLLANIMPYLQSYDYYWSAFNTDMYLGRGRVLVPKQMQSAKAKQDNTEYNRGLDSMLFTKIEMIDTEKQAPTPVQFDLRSQSWTEIRTMIIQNIAINTGMNLATIASFLTDNTAARTAREISTEESETALFVEDKREIVEKPINRILKLVTLYNGYTDDVVVRWAESGLTNIYARTDMLATAVQNGLVSKQTAAQMFKQDDDEYQQAEEWARIQSEEKAGAYDGFEYGGVGDDYSNAFESTGDRDRGSGSKDPGDREKGVFPPDAVDEDQGAGGEGDRDGTERGRDPRASSRGGAEPARFLPQAKRGA